MKTLSTLALLLAFAATALCQTTNSEDNYGSLFPAKFSSPYLTRKARNIGDIVTILIDENSQASYGATTSATKKDANAVDQLNVPIIGPILNGVRHLLRTDLFGALYRSLTGGLSTGANSSNAGAGTTTATTRLTARMAVTVREVLPNGNMVIEGTRMIKINRNDQDVTFTGIVRVDDVRADNTVLSESIADLRITNAGRGLIGERQRKGIITSLLDWLF